MASSRIAQLAQLIHSQVGLLDSHSQSNGLPGPSFEPDGPVEAFAGADANIQKATSDVIEAAIELRQLVEGPMKLLLPESNFSPLAAVHRFKIASAVPIGSHIPFADLADKCGLREEDVKRIVRYTAVHHRVFRELEKGLVTHTAASRLLAENPAAGHLMGLTFQECWPAHGRALDALALRSDEANVSGYALANATSLNTFQFLSQHQDRAQRFAFAMATTSKSSLDALAALYDWSSLEPGSTIVDVGGARGHVSIHLAQRFKHLNFVVQDLAEVVEGAEDHVPHDCQGRVAFMAHDMFSKQPSLRAKVYLLRYVLHDWTDRYCIDILRNLIPSLETGARVVVQDHLLPEPGTMSLLQEMQMRSMDCIMLSLFNSREREVDEWKHLFDVADARFQHFKASRIEENQSSGVVSVGWVS